MDNFSLRRIRTEDIDNLLEIADESGLSPWSRQDFAAEMSRDDAIMIVAATGTDPAEGFIIGRLTLGDGKDGPFEAEIYNIGVRKPSRRAGVGKMLLNAFIDRSRSANADCIWLEVRLSNIGAIAFYESLGFAAASTRRAFYTHPVEDAVIMKLELAKIDASS